MNKEYNNDTTTIHIRSDQLHDATARDHNTAARLYPDRDLLLPALSTGSVVAQSIYETITII